MNLKVSQIKPDPNQPRRTFDAEKMAVLEQSIKNYGFRENAPILIDEQNIIVDGERRWKAAKTLGLKEVPVEVVKGVKGWQRTLYQLQTEGVELDDNDRQDAWYSVYSNSKQTKRAIAKMIGVSEDTFKKAISRQENYLRSLELLKSAGKKVGTGHTRTQIVNARPALYEIGAVEDEKVATKLAEKAVEEDWSRDKTTEIVGAIKENPLQTKVILSHSYSDEGNKVRHWKTTLEVAKAGFSDEESKELVQTAKELGGMESQIGAFMDIFTYGLKLSAAMKRFDYTKVTPQKRVELHQKIHKFLPFVTSYIQELESYMIGKGELKRNVSLLK